MTDNEDIQGQPEQDPRMPDIIYKPGDNKLDSFNWLKDLPDDPIKNDIIEGLKMKNELQYILDEFKYKGVSYYADDKGTVLNNDAQIVGFFVSTPPITISSNVLSSQSAFIAPLFPSGNGNIKIAPTGGTTKKMAE